MSGVNLCHILFRMGEGFSYIRGRNLGYRIAVEHRSACGLFVKLENYSAERRFAAAGLTYYAECFALVDIERDFLVCTDIKLIFLENA